MPVTTFLDDSQLDQPTGDAELDELLAEAKSRTGRNYQIVTHRVIEHCGFLWLSRRAVSRTQLYLEVRGVGPWQVLGTANNTATIRAYLFGLLNGMRELSLQRNAE